MIRSDDLEIVGLGLSSSLQIVQLMSNHFMDHHKIEIPTQNVVETFKLKCSLILVLTQLFLKSYGYLCRSQVRLGNSED